HAQAESAVPARLVVTRAEAIGDRVARQFAGDKADWIAIGNNLARLQVIDRRLCDLLSHGPALCARAHNMAQARANSSKFGLQFYNVRKCQFHRRFSSL